MLIKNRCLGNGGRKIGLRLKKDSSINENQVKVTNIGQSQTLVPCMHTTLKLLFSGVIASIRIIHYYQKFVNDFNAGRSACTIIIFN